MSMNIAQVRRVNRTEAQFAFGAHSAVQIDINPAHFGLTINGYQLLISSDSDPTFRDTILDIDTNIGALGGGGDLRVVTDPYNSATRLAIDVVKCVPATTAANRLLEIWLEAGTVSSTTGKTIYLLWGIPGGVQPARDAMYGKEKVWEQPGSSILWRCVSHMNNLNINTVEDVTPYKHTMTKRANNFPTIDSVDVPWQGSDSQDFHTGSDNWIDISDATTLDLAPYFSIMVVFKTSGGLSNGWERLVSRKLTYTDLNGFELTLVNGSSTLIDAKSSNATDNHYTVPTTDDGNYHHIAVNYFGTLQGVVYDGVVLPNKTIVNVVNNNNPLVLGQDVNHTETDFTGNIAEFRYSNTVIQNDFNISIYKGMFDQSNHVTMTLL